MATAGNTVRLRAEFETLAGEPVDPNQVDLTIYDCKKNKIMGPIPIPVENEGHVVGVYEYDYTLPLEQSIIYFEFSGMLEGTPIVARGSIPVKWI